MNKVIRYEYLSIFLFLVSLTAFSKQFYDRYIFIRIILLAISLGVVLFSLKHKTLKVNVIVSVFSILIFYELLSGLWSYTFTNTLKFTSVTAISILAFLVFFQLDLKDNLKFVLIINAIVLVIYQISALSQIILNGWDPYEIHGLSGHKNLLSGFLLLSLPLTLVSLQYFRKHVTIILLKIQLLISLFLLIILQTRSVYLSLSVFFILLIVFGIRNYFSKSIFIQPKTFLKRYLPIPLGLALGLVFYFISIDHEIKKDFLDKINFTNYFQAYNKGNISDIAEDSHKSIEIRKILWKSTLDLVHDKPIFGYGKGNWSIAIGKIATSKLPDRLHENNTYSHPHNDYLQQLAETGIIGFILMIFPVIFIIGMGYKFLLSRKRNQSILFITLGLTSFLVFMFFDFPLQNVEHSIFFFLQVLLLYQFLKLEGVIRFDRSIVIRKELILGLLLILLIPTIIQFRSDYHALKGVQYESENKNTAAIYHLKKANNSLYNITPANFPLDYIVGRIHIKNGDYSKAIPLVESAIGINPFEFRALNDYGMLLYYSGRDKKAIEIFCRAMDIAPYFEEPRFNIAAIYFEKKKYDEALEILEPLQESEKKKAYVQQILNVMKPGHMIYRK